jgi:hypothetical protein
MKLSSEDFCKLRDEWYRKIKESGFEDIEQIHHSGKFVLKVEHRRMVRRGRNDDETRRSCQTDYYRIMSQMVNDPKTKFRCEMDRFVMSLYAEGKKRPEIKDRILQKFDLEFDLHIIRYIIDRYEITWNLKRPKKIRLPKSPVAIP